MKQNRLLEDPVRSVFLSYLVPSVSATLVTSIYILADTMMIGRGIGSVGIAALNILLPLYSTFFGFGMMCGIGGSVLFGFSRGKGNEREARGYFTTGLLMALVFAVLTLTLCNVFFDPLLRLLGVTPAMREHAVAYGRVLVTASPMCVMSSFLQAFVRNDGVGHGRSHQRRRHQRDPGLRIYFHHEMGHGRSHAGHGNGHDPDRSDLKQPFLFKGEPFKAPLECEL